MSNSVDIVIVNWNSGLQLRNCIDSLVAPVVKRIIIIDNASSDSSSQYINFDSRVKLIRSTENLGFGRACNLGARLAKENLVLFLNPDAAIYEETLDRVLKFIQDTANSDVGICGVQLINESGEVARSCARFPTPFGLASHAVGLDRLFPRLGHFMVEWPHDKTQGVDQVIGAFFLVRRKLFESLGGFDERFFVYFEEVDFSLRARQAGFRSVYFAEAQAFHAGGGTSNQVKAKRLFYSLRSRLLYAAKHFSIGGAAAVFVTTLLIEPLSRSALALARWSLPALRETWQGYAMLWRWLPQWVLKGVTR